MSNYFQVFIKPFSFHYCLIPTAQTARTVYLPINLCESHTKPAFAASEQQPDSVHKTGTEHLKSVGDVSIRYALGACLLPPYPSGPLTGPVTFSARVHKFTRAASRAAPSGANELAESAGVFGARLIPENLSSRTADTAADRVVSRRDCGVAADISAAPGLPASAGAPADSQQWP